MIRTIALAGCLLLILSACRSPAVQAPLPSPTLPAPTAIPTATAVPTTTSEPAPTSLTCQLQPVVVPTMPAVIPDYTELDRSTGLHMTGTPQRIDVQAYRLEVTGKVDHPLKLTYDQLRCLPREESTAELVCPGFFTDHAVWAGPSLSAVLTIAGVQAGAFQITLYGADAYQNYVSLSDALKPGNILAYEWNGEPLPILHGFPLRAVFPGMQGNKWMKWLIRIEVQ